MASLGRSDLKGPQIIVWQAKHAKNEIMKAKTIASAAMNAVDALCNVHPNLTASVNKKTQIACAEAAPRRGVPLVDHELSHIIRMAFCSVRGTRNMMRVFTCGVWTVQRNLKASAMLLMLLLLGQPFAF